MWYAHSAPAVRPIPLGEAETGLPVDITECLVDRQHAPRLVEFQQVGAILWSCRGGYHQPPGLRIPPRPMREISIAEFQARDFDGFSRIRDVEHDEAVYRW